MLVTLVLIGLVGGLITGISPCVLPVLPVLFLTGGTQPGEPTDGPRTLRQRRRPYFIVGGLALSFAVFTLLGTLLLHALHLPQDVIRWGGVIVLILLGLGMIVPRVESLLERPFSRIPQRNVGTDRGGFVLGLALGAVYVPCAGPVLAAITVAGATGEIGVRTVVLTVSFAIGTALPLLFFALAGQSVAERVRAFRNRQRAVRVGAGVVVIALAVALSLNATDAIQRTVPDYTASLNDAVDHQPAVAKALGPAKSTPLSQCVQVAEQLATSKIENCGAAPAITGIDSWFNTPGNQPLSLASLKGKVVLLDFWAYSCINCQRAIAHVNAWNAAYAADGLTVIGVHTPEYAFEHVAGNVKAGAKRLGIQYPVALDNDYKTWNAYTNNSWPAEYLIGSDGIVRDVSIGEGDYSTTEGFIRQLLTAANPSVVLPAATEVPDKTPTEQQSPETYLGGQRASQYAGKTALRAGTMTFPADPGKVPEGGYVLTGTWQVSAESIAAVQDAGITLNFLARDIYLDVSGTGTITATVDGKTTTYQVSGAPDIYTLLDRGTSEHSTLHVVLSPGLSAYSFTFG